MGRHADPSMASTPSVRRNPWEGLRRFLKVARVMDSAIVRLGVGPEYFVMHDTGPEDLVRMEAAFRKLDPSAQEDWMIADRELTDAIRDAMSPIGPSGWKFDEGDEKTLLTTAWKAASRARRAAGSRDLDEFRKNVRLLKEAVEAFEAKNRTGPNSATRWALLTSTQHRDAEIAAQLRRDRKTRQAELVEFMVGKTEATVQEIAEKVHGNPETSDQAVRKNARETSESLVQMGIPMRFTVHSGRVFREISPE